MSDGYFTRIHGQKINDDNAGVGPSGRTFEVTQGEKEHCAALQETDTPTVYGYLLVVPPQAAINWYTEASSADQQVFRTAVGL